MTICCKGLSASLIQTHTQFLTPFLFSLLLYAHFLLSTPNLQTGLKDEHAYYMPIGLYDLNNNLPFHILFERFSLIIIILIEFNLYVDDDDDAPKNC